MLDDFNLFQGIYPETDNKIINDICDATIDVLNLLQDEEHSIFSVKNLKTELEYRELEILISDIPKFSNLEKYLEPLTKSFLKEIGVEEYTISGYGIESYSVFYLLKSTLNTINDALIEITITNVNIRGKDTIENIPANKIEELSSLLKTLETKLKLIDKMSKNHLTLTLSVRLNQQSKITGINQSQIAELMNIRGSSVNEWFTGKSLPSLGRLKHLAALLNTSVDYLLGNSEQEFSIEDIIMRNIGINPHTLSRVKNIKLNHTTSFTKLSRTLNLLLENYDTWNKYDLLSRINKYLDPNGENPFYVITKKDFDDGLTELFSDFSSLDEHRKGLANFHNRIEQIHQDAHGTMYDSSVFELESIKSTLKEIKDKLEKDHFDTY